MLIIALTIFAGALVAGMDAGLLYNHYPLMGDGLVPVEYGEMGLLDPFENPASAQFHHRWIAASCRAGGDHACRQGPPPAGKPGAGNAGAGAGCGQFVLGIAVLLHGVPVSLGAMHQTGAVLLLGSVVWTAHRMARWTADGAHRMAR